MTRLSDNMPYRNIGTVKGKARTLRFRQKPLSFLPPAFPPIQAKQEKWFTTRHRLLSYLTMHADCARLIPEARLLGLPA